MAGWILHSDPPPPEKAEPRTLRPLWSATPDYGFFELVKCVAGTLAKARGSTGVSVDILSIRHYWLTCDGGLQQIAL